MSSHNSSSTSLTTVRSKIKPTTGRFVALLFLLLSLFASWRSSSSSSNDLTENNASNGTIDPKSVYVPGAGFSGFWFTLGRLRSLPNPWEHNYYCFSAGCLGVVATLSNRTFEDMSEMAFGVQRKWNEGEISRYDVVEDFVDRLLPSSVRFGDELLERISVVTVTEGVGTNIRRARSVAELREMLIQTTWIPFATGWGLWNKDKSGSRHMDGGFTFFFHPRYRFNLKLPLMPDLFLNILNPNLSARKVQKFWNAGLGYGIRES